jgi:hypothetical protein
MGAATGLALGAASERKVRILVAGSSSECIK